MIDTADRDWVYHWIGALERTLFTAAWRPMEIIPPLNTLLVCACEDGLQLMTINDMGDWRTNTGQPHKPPRAWMPAPKPPQR